MQIEGNEERELHQTTITGNLSVEPHKNPTGWFSGSVEAWLN